jgi:hypothetical protein
MLSTLMPRAEINAFCQKWRESGAPGQNDAWKPETPEFIPGLFHQRMAQILRTSVRGVGAK